MAIVVVAAAIALGGCKPWPPSMRHPSRSVLIVPRTIMAHALAAQHCAYRALVDTRCASCRRRHRSYDPLTQMRWEADVHGANVIVLTVGGWFHRSNPAGWRWVQRHLEGEALFCAPKMVRRLARLYGAEAGGAR